MNRAVISVRKHPARGSRQFKCDCGVVHEWPQSGVQGKKIPEGKRDLHCLCGILHTR